MDTDAESGGKGAAGALDVATMTGTQAGMFDVQAKRKVQRGDVVFSLSFDERKIIQAIIDLYNNGEPFDLDPTYSTGRLRPGFP